MKYLVETLSTMRRLRHCNGNGTNIALLAKNRKDVDAFYSAAVIAGARDEGTPGLRAEVHPHFYTAYLWRPRWPQTSSRLPCLGVLATGLTDFV